MAEAKKLISIISPCFNEQDNVEDCYETVKSIFQKELPSYDYEHIFCDNYSKDDTVKILRSIASQDKRVKIILNSRNYGPLPSTFNGILRSSGDAVLCLLAVDQQDPPGLIPDFVKKWEEGYQVVAGVRKTREEGIVMRLCRKIFYQLVSKMSYFPILPDVGEFQLIDKIVVDALRQFGDHHPYIRGMIASCGYESTIIEYTWKARKRGKSKLDLLFLINEALNGIISFSQTPLRLATYFGLTISIGALLYAFFLLVYNVIYFRVFSIPGIATITVAIFFFAGVQLLFLGILGEYIGSIHSQVRKRPLIIEKELINF